MNRYNWTDALIDELKREVKAKTTFHPLASRATVVKGRLYVDGKLVLMPDEIEKTLQTETENGAAPLGIRSLQHYMNQKYIGITRPLIRDFLKVDKRLQDMQFRPPTSTKVRKKTDKEGTTDFEFERHPNCLGVDLIALGGQAFSDDFRDGNSHLIVVVHKFSSYIWAKTMQSPSASNAKRGFSSILNDAKKKFGKMTKVQRDGGGEFKGVFAAFCKSQGIQTQTLRKVSYVERANSTLKRYMKFLSTQHDIEDATKLALQKMNATRNRVTGKTPTELTGTTTRQRPDRKRTSWQGGRTKPKVYQKGDIVQHINKIAERQTAILYKSFNAKTWSQPTEVQYRKGNKYRVKSNQDYLYSADELRPYIKPKTRKRPNYKAPETVYVPRPSRRRGKAAADLLQLDNSGRVKRQTKHMFS